MGASERSFFSVAAFDNFKRAGTADIVHLVNPRSARVHGRATYPSCRAIGSKIDVAYMMVPKAAMLEALEDVAAAGATGAVILSAGYSEAGSEGRRAERELVEHARKLGLLLLGPNHVGFVNFVDGIPLTSIPDLPSRSGEVALLSQSGASSRAMLEFAGLSGIDLSYLITVGNEAMVNVGHLIEFLAHDDHTRAVAVFLEAVREPATFRAACISAQRAGLPIVVLKTGRTELAAKTAAAHTGALVGDDAVFDAVFDELNVIRVDTIEDMLITAGAAARLGRLDQPGIGVVSISGGACDIIADRAADAGAELPSFDPSTEELLHALLGADVALHNPMDLTGAAMKSPRMFTDAIETISRDRSVGVVAVVNEIPWQEGQQPNVDQLNAVAEGVARSAVPVVHLNQVAQPVSATAVKWLQTMGIGVELAGLRQGVAALAAVGRWSARVTDDAAEPSRAIDLSDLPPREGPWGEHAARDLLVRAGIPVVASKLVATAEEAAAATAEYPVAALKVVSPDILHKSDLGGVRLDVRGPTEAATAFVDIMTSIGEHCPHARVEGVMVSPMVGAGPELIVGVTRDSVWGPVLAVGLGGVFVEVLDDVQIGTLPVGPRRARTLLQRLRGAKILDGLRGAAPVNIDQVVDVICRVSDLALQLGDELDSLEINPLRAVDGKILALDELVTWRPTGAQDTPSGATGSDVGSQTDVPVAIRS